MFLPPAILFGFPAAAYFAAVALPVAAAFFYRRRATVVEVPAVSLWEKVGRPVPVRSFASVLRRLLSLLAQLFLVATLVFALADPWPARVAARRVVVVLDASATMQTREGPGGTDRMELARQRAAAVLAAAPAGAEATVVLAGRSPTLAQPLTKDLAAARLAVSRAAAQDVEGDLSAAVRTASAFVGRDVPADVVVVSDFAAEAPDVLRDRWSGWGGPGRLRLIAVGHDHPDVAVTDFWSEPQPPGPPDPSSRATTGPAATRPGGDARRVVVTLAERGMDGRTVPVRLRVDGQVAGTQQVQLRPGPVQVEFPAVAAAPGAVLKVEVDSGDALAADDVAYSVVPAREQVRICLVTAGDRTLERALRADPSVRLRVVAPDQFHGPEGESVGESVVIFDGPGSVPPPPPGGAGATPGVGYLFIGTPDPFGWGETRDWVAVPPVTHWAGDHPTLLDIDPSLIHVPSALRLTWHTRAPVTALISADTTPVAVALAPRAAGAVPAAPGNHSPDSDPSSPCVYWLFDLKSTDLPRRATFPLLLWNTVDFLASRPTDAEAAAALTGRPLVLPRSADRPGTAGEMAVRVTGPDGAPVPVHTTGGVSSVHDTTKQGVYVCRDASGNVRSYAVNLLSARGTAPLPAQRPDEGVPADESPAKAGLADWKHRYAKLAWDSLLLTAVAIGLVEWFLFHRRVVQV